MQAIILSFDSLTANSIGCYGNEWIETPHCDQLAATGIVFDRCFADTVGATAGRCWSTGRRSSHDNCQQDFVTLGRQLGHVGIDTRLITVDSVFGWQRDVEFDDIRVVERVEGADALPDHVSIANLVKAGLNALDESSSGTRPGLLWLHAPGPSLPPSGFDSLYFEDFEERGDPVSDLSDEQKAVHPAVYAGSVSLIDHWLGELMSGIDNHLRSTPTMLIVMAAQGHLWQQHRSMNPTEFLGSTSPLCDQNIRVPLVIRITNDERYQDYRSVRTTRMVQTLDLRPTLLDWFRVENDVIEKSFAGQSWLQEALEAVPGRTSLFVGDQFRHAVRTNNWLYIRENQSESSQVLPAGTDSFVSLFSKPEDIWDVNNVAGQHPELLENFQKEIASATRNSLHA